MCNCNNSQNKAYLGYPPCGCNSSNNIVPLINTNCGTCEEEIGCINTNSECVIYNGDPLTNLQVDTGDNLNVVLQKINDIYTTGVDPDYSTYNTACLTESGSTSTQSQFVETISAFVCTTNTNLNTFINSTYATYVTTTATTINSIRIPGTTGCTTMPIPGGSTINQILQIFSNTLCSISTAINVASINWSGCFTVTVEPTNVYDAFTEVLRQICIVNSSIGDITSDTYKVKLLNTDTTEDYLQNKLVSSSCITINPITISSVNKLQLGLSFTPSSYLFNPSQFDVTTGTSNGCVQTYNVSLASSIGTGTGTVSSVALTMPSGFIVSNSPVTSTGTLAVTTTLNGNLRGNGSGFVVGNINANSELTGIVPLANGGTGMSTVGTSGQVLMSNGTALVYATPTSGGTVTSVGVSLPSDTFTVTNSPITSSGTITATHIPQLANTFLIGPQSGSSATPTWRTLITADIPNNTVTYAKMQQVNIGKRLLGNYTNAAGNVQQIAIGTGLVLSDGGVLSASGGSFTPNTCYNTPYNALTTIIPPTVTNGTSQLTVSFVDFTTQPSSLVNTQPSILAPGFIFDAAGNMHLLGNVTFQLDSVPSPTIEDIIIPFADVSSFLPACGIVNKYFHKHIGTYTTVVGSSLFGFIEVYLCYDVSNFRFNFLLKTKSPAKFNAVKFTISLDQVSMNFNDIN